MNFASYYLTMGVLSLVLLMVVSLYDSEVGDDDDDMLNEDEWKTMMRAYFDQKFLAQVILLTILAWPVVLVFAVMGRRR